MVAIEIGVLKGRCLDRRLSAPEGLKAGIAAWEGTRNDAGARLRSWHGWYRHITLAMLALAFLAAMRVKFNAVVADKKETRDLDPWLISARTRSTASSAACNSSPALPSIISSPGRCGAASTKQPLRSAIGDAAGTGAPPAYKLNRSIRVCPETFLASA